MVIMDAFMAMAKMLGMKMPPKGADNHAQLSFQNPGTVILSGLHQQARIGLPRFFAVGSVIAPAFSQLPETRYNAAFFNLTQRTQDG